MSLLSSIPEFYRNKSVLITGGTGFVGKVLIEKLLRSCPDLKNIYLLIREKKSQSPEERIKTITDLPLFDLVRSQKPDSLAKIKAVNGDVRELDLGLHPEDRKLLTNDINVVFHVAASIRFDDSLKDAILINTRGTRELVQLALDMKNLDVFVHVSTTYCNTDQKVVEERLYPPHADWRKTIEIAENAEKHVLNVFTKKLIHPLPNTYTFTKSLAEHVVHDLCEGKIPAVIFRPSIIMPTDSEPIPGWIDNFNGPIGLITVVCKGVVSSVYTNPDVITDFVPVDVIVKGIIISSWKQVTYKEENNKLKPSLYNGSNQDVNPVSMGSSLEMSKKVSVDVPLDNVIWYPNFIITKNYYIYFIKVIVYHLLPALFLDGFLKILGKKPRMLKIQRRIYIATMALEYFTNNHWNFLNERFLNLSRELLPSDVDSFSYREEEVEKYEFCKKILLGIRKYLLKEDGNLEEARRHSRRMWVMAQIGAGLQYLILFWLIFIKLDFFGLLIHKCNQSFIMDTMNSIYLFNTF